MVDCENSPKNYKTLEIGIRVIIKDPEIVRFILDNLKGKKCVKFSSKVAVCKNICS